MAKISVDYRAVEQFVDRQKAKGVDMYWDGWDILIHRPNRSAFFDKNGAFRNGKWGTQVRVSPDARGVYRVPTRYVSVR